MKKLNGELNPKIAKKITRYLIEDKFTYEEFFEESKEFKSFHSYFLNFINSDLNYENFKLILNFLNIKISQKLTSEIINKTKTITNVYKMIDFFVLSCQKKIFGQNTFLFFNLLLNKWLYDNGYSLIIIYPSFANELKMMINNNEDMLVIRQLIVTFYHDSYIRNTIFKIRYTSEIVNDLLEIKNILNDQYKIHKLWIFGSYSKNRQKKFSDLDIFIEIGYEAKVFELEAIDDFLSVLLEVKVNVVVENSFIHYDMLEVF